MNFVINDSQLFLLLDSVFPDLSVKKIRSQNPAYAIESNDDEMFHYENGSVNVNPDFVKMVNKFAPIRMTNDVVVSIGKWINKRTGLKPRVIWIGLKEYNVEPNLNESFDKLRARRFMHIANDYFNNLNPKDVCDYWSSDEVDDYINETMSEMVRFITDEYPDVSAEDWQDTYDGIYNMLEGIGYSNDVRDFFYESLDNCNNLNESEEEYEDNDDAIAKVIGNYLNRNEYEGVNSIWVDYNVLFDTFDINVFVDKQFAVDLKSAWPSHWNRLRYEITDDVESFFPDFKFSCYHHFGKGINESMDSDKPMKKFNRDSNPNPGKYGKMIEKLTYQYFSDIKESVCDVICMKADNLDSYILLVLLNHSRSEVGLVKYLENFIPIDIMVLFRTSFGCDKED
jgi:hypothetical protein